jgi:hypothetical protein
MRSVIDSSA